MNGKQLMAILLSAVMTVSAGMPLTGVSAQAAENMDAAGAEYVAVETGEVEQVQEEGTFEEDRDSENTEDAPFPKQEEGAEDSFESESSDSIGADESQPADEDETATEETAENSTETFTDEKASDAAAIDAEDEEDDIQEKEDFYDTEVESGAEPADGASAGTDSTGQEAVDTNLDSDSEPLKAGTDALDSEDPVDSVPEEEAVVTEAQNAGSDNFTIEDGVLTKYNGDGGDIVIPDGVTSIGDWAFSGCSSLASVTIQEGVTSIGDHAFWDCSSLTSVTIPGSVTSIGDWAFSGCSSLTSVTIPGSVTSIGDWAFVDCSSLTSVTIPKGVTSIGDNAFYRCTSLMSMTISGSVTSIGYATFRGCSSLTSVTIPGSVTSIGGGAFADCSGLLEIMVAEENGAYSSEDGILFNRDQTAIYCFPAGKSGNYSIPEGVTSVGLYAFAGCSSLPSVTIPGSVTSIGNGAFENCNSLKSVTIPESVTSIGNGAFCGCSSLASVTIPEGVTSIGYWAFEDCSSLTSVTIPGSVTSILDSAFRGCNSLASVTIPEGVTSIGDWAFSGCSSLASVTIPGSVTSIGYAAFNKCTSLTDVYYSGSEESWNQISTDEGNDDLLNATIHFNFINEAVEVTRIALDKTSADLACTKTLQLVATVTPADATDKTVTWKSSNASIATVDKNGLVKAKKYGKATITATTSNGKKATCAIQTRFTDVANSGKSYYQPVYWAVDKGITVVSVNFRPEDSVTRGEFVAFLWRLAGKPKSTAKVSLKDVNAKTKFYDAIRWAVGKGIIKGYSDGTFKPDNNVTRGETAVMIWRYAGKPAPKTKKNPFSDIKASTGDSYKAILWGSENGIIKGSGGKFLKDDGCTRGQVVTFLYRYSKK